MTIKAKSKKQKKKKRTVFENILTVTSLVSSANSSGPNNVRIVLDDEDGEAITDDLADAPDAKLLEETITQILGKRFSFRFVSFAFLKDFFPSCSSYSSSSLSFLLLIEFAGSHPFSVLLVFCFFFCFAFFLFFVFCCCC